MSESDLTNQEKLEEVYRLTVENNHLLHKIQNRERIAFLLRIGYWLLILGVLGGAFYYVQYFFDGFFSGDSQAGNMFQQFEDLRSQLPESRAVQEFFDQFGNDVSTSSIEQG